MLNKFLNLILPAQKIPKEKFYKIIEYRNFLDRKNNIFSIFPYKNKLVSQTIKDLKFKNYIENAEFFGEVLWDNSIDYLEELKIKEDFHNPILITVPIHFFRKLKRGYNQNDLIIKSFMDHGGENFIFWEKNNLVKIKHRKPQSRTKSKKERLENQKNAYKIKKPEHIKNKNIILFDDIYTTGATINEIKKLLLKKGARKVKIIVLAH